VRLVGLAQRDALERAEGVAGRERARGGGDQGIHGARLTRGARACAIGTCVTTGRHARGGRGEPGLTRKALARVEHLPARLPVSAGMAEQLHREGFVEVWLFPNDGRFALKALAWGAAPKRGLSGIRRRATRARRLENERMALLTVLLALAFESSLAALLALATPCPGHAAAPTDPAPLATRFHCPASLVQQPVADGLPPGWVVHGPAGELRLQRAAFYDGDPVGLGTLAPDSTRRSGFIETSTWSFADGDSARVWLGCLYRNATAVVARPLPGGLHQCTTVLRLTSLGEPSDTLEVQCR